MNKQHFKNFKDFYLVGFIGVFGGLIAFILSNSKIFSPVAASSLKGLSFGLLPVGILSIVMIILTFVSPTMKTALIKNQKIQTNDERLKLVNSSAQAKSFSITLYALCTALILSGIINIDLFVVLIILLLISFLSYIFFLNYYSSKL